MKNLFLILALMLVLMMPLATALDFNQTLNESDKAQFEMNYSIKEINHKYKNLGF